MQRQLPPYPLILSSSSPARRELLSRLGIAYTTISPDVDETALPDEKAPALVKRLARAKAEVAALTYPQAIIIGADQVGTLENTILGKPLTLEKAKEHLQMISGKTIVFYTGICLYHAVTEQFEIATETYSVTFRELSGPEIDHYLKLEQPLHCAGSFHVEGLGISLISRLQGDDYTALIGLPLIRLTAMLK